MFGGFDGKSKLGDACVLKLDGLKWEAIGTPAASKPAKAGSKAAPVAQSGGSPSPRCWHTAVWVRVPLFIAADRTPGMWMGR